jgi:branched-chain amino acid transport system substrate-binding protein
VLYLNYSAVDPDLTNSKCSFWHFRFDSHNDQKMAALTNFIANQPKIKSVYIIGQDYAHGHQFARAAEAMLKEKRPDIKIVGNDLHQIGKVKDFSPYVTKIAASRADVVLTGNWGNDLTLLVKAAVDAGLKTPFYTYYAGSLGVVPTLGAGGVDRLVQVTEWHANISPNPGEEIANEFKRRYHQYDYYYARAETEMMMLVKAMKETNSTEPRKVALALEGMHYKGDGGEVWIRKQDHQIMQPQYISTLAKVDGKMVKYGAENTQFGYKTDVVIPARDGELPTNCNFQRP